MAALDEEWPAVVAFGTADITVSAGLEPVLIDLAELKKHPLVTTAASKLQWALGNLTALEHNITQAFGNPADCAVLRADLDPETGYHVLRIEAQADLTDFAENFQHSVADIANNIRAALDKLAWLAACDFTNGTPQDVPGVKFPICDTTKDWINAGRARNQLRPDHCGFVKRFQPCEGPSPYSDGFSGPYIHQLTLLRELSNDDKHRDTEPVLLSPTTFQFRRFAIAQMTQIPPEPMDWHLLSLGKEIKLGMEVLEIRLPAESEAEIHDIARAAPGVALSEGRYAVATLQRLHRHVHLILSEFAREFP